MYAGHFVGVLNTLFGGAVELAPLDDETQLSTDITILSCTSIMNSTVISVTSYISTVCDEIVAN